MREECLNIGEIPAVLYGEKQDRLYLFVHGKQGCKEEGKDFAEIAHRKGWQTLAIDLPAHGARQDSTAAFDPWHVVPELQAVMNYGKDHWPTIALRANSIGAWFSMLAFPEETLERSLFVSPVLDMQALILNMMRWAGVDRAQLQAEQEIATPFGETLSWRYLQYAQEHPVTRWKVDTAILYAGKDKLTERSVVDDFVRRFGCDLTVMEEGEHWFHTAEQLAVLRNWERTHI